MFEDGWEAPGNIEVKDLSQEISIRVLKKLKHCSFAAHSKKMKHCSSAIQQTEAMLKEHFSRNLLK